MCGMHLLGLRLIINKLKETSTRIYKMDAMQNAEIEMQASLMQTVMSLCTEKTLKRSHTSNQLSSDEKTQYTNCVLKALEAPGHIMAS